MDALIQSEMEHIEATYSATREEDSELHALESDELHIKEQTVINLDYGDESFDFDESDEKRLLSHQLESSDTSR